MTQIRSRTAIAHRRVVDKNIAAEWHATAPERLDHLATSITGHHRACQEHARKTLDEAIGCGTDLMEARRLVPDGSWQAWLRENVRMEKTTANMYVRIATFSEELKAVGIDRIQAARDYIRAHGLKVEITSAPLADEVVIQIRDLAQEGLSQRKIGSRVGVAKSTVGRIVRGERQLQAARGESAGPAQLATRVRAVMDARRANDTFGLQGALFDLAQTATDWANSLGVRRAA